MIKPNKKIILIISNSNDISTHEVIDWIHCLKKEYIVINELSNIKISKINLETNEINFILDDIKIKSKDISNIWYRKGDVNFDTNHIIHDNMINHDIIRFLSEELKPLNNFFFNILKQKTNSINDYSYAITNKLIILSEAKKIGLKIPKTIAS